MIHKKLLYSIVFIILFTHISNPILAEETFIFSKPFSGVYLVRDDEEEIIIHRQGNYVAPKLSPDGERVIFHSREGGTMGIWLTDLKGLVRERVCDGDQANWSPDGKRIAFRREGRVMERDIASGVEKFITPENWLSCEFPGYLPDGKILFVSNNTIFLMGPDNKTPSEPLIEGDIRSAPDGSPDGKKIAYQDGSHIFLLDLTSKKSSQLTMAGGVQSCPIWSSDGLSLCYCQSSEAFHGPWDICNVKVDSPENVSLIVRDVEVNPDWRGSNPSEINTVEIKGGSISLWQIGESLEKRESWKLLPMNDNFNAEGEIVVENDWLIFFVSQKDNKLSIFSKIPEIAKNGEIILNLINKKGKSAASIDSTYISSDEKSVILKTGFRSQEGDLTYAAFTVSKSRPYIGIKPVENLDRVFIQKDTHLVLLPDRLSDDLILNPQKYSTPRILLPRGFFFTCLDDRGMFLVFSLDNQEMYLTKGENPNFFTGVEALAGTSEIFISPLYGNYLWHKTSISLDDNTNKWHVEWSNPFLAYWRNAITGEEKYYSRFWNEETLISLTNPSLPLEFEFTKPPETSIIYLYGRSWNTPLDILTPEDILRDAIGIEKYKILMDIDGIRTYRTAKNPVPLHVFLTSQENRLWPESFPGWPQTLDFSPIYQLLIRIRMVERKGVESIAANLCQDILNSLKGLDDRIDEYKSFLASLENFAGSIPFRINESIDDLRLEIADLPLTDLGVISDSIEAIRLCLGTNDELWDRGEFYRFRELTESALSERQEILALYRNFTKELRNKAGIAITENPELKDKAEEIRKITHSLLR
ncbi:hypothetical protein FJZ33_06565, partial [Candidatus Poribacteria bacterium]|nr:hypothetical protein [Candidatus Poribacteria bacterium]